MTKLNRSLTNIAWTMLLAMLLVMLQAIAVSTTASAAEVDANPADDIAQVAVDVPHNEFVAIEGVVRDGNDEGLSGITVRAYRQQEGDAWEMAAEQVTNGYGGYRLEQLAAGTYRVSFTDPAGQFAGEWYQNGATAEEAQSLILSRSGETALASAWLRRAGETPQPGSVRGKVENQVYDPVAGIQVSVLQAEGMAAGTRTGENPPWTEVVSTTTDSQGNYVLGGLVDGSYYVRFADPGRQYRAQYYPSVTQWQAAIPLEVEGNLTRTADARLELLSPGSIAGTLVDPQQQPLADVVVTALRSEAGAVAAAGWQEVVTATTDAWGGYTLYNLADGYYRLRFDDPHGQVARQYYHVAPTLESAQIFSITRGVHPSLAGEQLGLPLVTQGLRGSLVDEAGQPLPSMQVIVYQEEGLQRAEVAWRSVLTGTTDAVGSYQLSLPAGSYRLGFGDPTGVLAPAITMGRAHWPMQRS